jgi:hypothetical protein
MNLPPRRCKQCKTTTAKAIRVTQYSTNAIPSGKSFRYRCSRCSLEFELQSIPRLVLMALVTAFFCSGWFMMPHFNTGTFDWFSLLHGALIVLLAFALSLETYRRFLHRT